MLQIHAYIYMILCQGLLPLLQGFYTFIDSLEVVIILFYSKVVVQSVNNVVTGSFLLIFCCQSSDVSLQICLPAAHAEAPIAGIKKNVFPQKARKPSALTSQDCTSRFTVAALISNIN